MSSNPFETSESESSKSNYQAIFDSALVAYKNKTGKDLASDPLLRRLESCDSPESVIILLREQMPGFDQSGGNNNKLTRWLSPTVNVLYMFSSTTGGAVSLVYPPVAMIFTGIGILLTAVKDISTGQGTLEDIFERIENVFRRLEAYVGLPPTAEMIDIIVKVMAEVLRILALVTKEIKQGTLSTSTPIDRLPSLLTNLSSVGRCLKKVAGRSDIEDALRRLDKLTQDEYRMATARNLRVTHAVGDKVDLIVNGADNQKWDQLLRDIKNWLSPPDPSINYNIFSAAHHEGTGVWFTESDVFKIWKETSLLLWIHGKPGAGKSVLTSAIIRDINGLSNAGSAYVISFFFDFQDIAKQDARGLLSSLIIQLSDRSSSLYHILSNFYSAHQKGSSQPSIDELTKCFEELLVAAGDIPIYLILDALDECPNTNGIRSSRDEVLVVVEKLVKLNLTKLHICVTSRPEADIRISLEPLTSVSNRISIHEQSGQKRDIFNFVRAFICSDKIIQRWRDEDKELVIETLSGKADDMFRWTVCQLEALRHCLPPSVRSTLTELPESLDETYERILQQIHTKNQLYAHRLLQCLTVAVRPLRVEELAEVLAVDFSVAGGTPRLDEHFRSEDKEQAVLFACSSLITVVDVWGLRQVQFSHFSVQEFLTSGRLAGSNVDALRYHHILLEPAHTVMAQACLGVLLRLTNDMSKETIATYPLARYASEHLAVHAEFEDVLSRIVDGVDDLLDPDKPHFDTWVWLQMGDWESYLRPDFSLNDSSLVPRPPSLLFPTYPPRVSPLYYVATLGHLCLARRLISKRPEDIHSRDDKGYAPLHMAVFARKVRVAQLLIEHSVDLDTWDIEDRTLLHITLDEGLVEVVQALLEHDKAIKTRVNARDRNGWTALHLASQYCYLGILASLLRLNPDIDVQDNDGVTPLLMASHGSSRGAYFGSNNDAIARLLLEHGASIHVRNNNGKTPLHLALQYGYPRIVELLLNFGAEVDAQDNDGMTPLHSTPQGQGSLWDSMLSDFQAAVRLLLEHGTSVHVRNKNGETPLHVASLQGHPSTMALLLDFHAEVDAQDNNGMTPLHLALQASSLESSISDFGQAVQLLLKHGASVHSRNKNGQTPLHIAAEHRHPSFVLSLLKLNADVEAQDNNGVTPLHSALSGSPWESLDSEVVQLLLEHGASVHARNKNDQTPLHIAAGRHDPSLVSSLLKLGADVEAQDNTGMTPLHSALSGSSWELLESGVVQLLVEHGASVHARNKNDQTLLHIAAKYHDNSFVSSLLKLGADLEAQDNNGMTPLHSALQGPWELQDSDFDGVVELLVEHGASVHARNNNGQTPLHLAVETDYLTSVSLLLKFGADVDAQDHDGMTPLLLASKESPISVIDVYDRRCMVAQQLLEHGATIHLRDRNGQTPLHAASQDHLSSIVALLLTFGAEVDAQDYNNMTPLHFAISSPRQDRSSVLAGSDVMVIQLLLEHGASIQAENNDGESPLQVAWARGEEEFTQTLLEYMHYGE